uniref:Chlorophyll a-b binding protein, chloroplastic n=1 Tax=Alexandrium monilatum TaxID=311494 RepID=A0A7S4UGY2_9DINO
MSLPQSAAQAPLPCAALVCRSGALAPPSSPLPQRGGRTPAAKQGVARPVGGPSRGPPLPAAEGGEAARPLRLAGSSLAALAAAAALGRRTARQAAAAEVKGEAGEGEGASAEPSDALAADLAEAKAKAAAAKQKKPEPFDVTAQAGVCEPLGYWDPMGFCPLSDRPKFRKLRTAELKHGRVAMLASVGLVAQHYARLPTGTFDDVPNGIWAPFTPWGGFGCCAIIWVSLVLEFVVWAQDPFKEVGDFGDPLNVNMYDSEMRNRELNNGRFAMFATAGILLAELATGRDAVEQLSL